MSQELAVAIVIPAYKVTEHVCEVVGLSLKYAQHIIVVDDLCPSGSGKLVQEKFGERVHVVFRSENGGVGAATISGAEKALELGADVIVKVDGDGQMDPSLVPLFVEPIFSGRADYTKGNRFFKLESLKSMPAIRLFGNAVLSLLSKFAHGYWNIMDPTNGFFAIHASVLRQLPLAKIERRYFFENDMLFRLGTLRAVVVDVPMDAKYEDEESNLSISHVLVDFPPKFIARFFKRLFYSYVLRDFSPFSVEFVFGILLTVFGFTFGAIQWMEHVRAEKIASAGTVMLAGLPVLVGLNLLIAALSYDMSNVPSDPIHPVLPKKGN